MIIFKCIVDIVKFIKLTIEALNFQFLAMHSIFTIEMSDVMLE